MILLIDNYDSFAYNLYQLVGSIHPDIKVIRNDEMTIEEIELLSPSHIILSPGPGRPSDAGIIEDVVRHFYKDIPILGVCLGHQAIIEAFGGVVTYAKELMHGKSSTMIKEYDSILFNGVNDFTIARYHSLAGQRETLNQDLRVSGVSEDGEIMAIEHKEYPLYGLQFHPESILTKEGYKMLENFINGGIL